MSYDFETFPPRRGTSSLKWDHGQMFVGRDDLLAMWVADMDFVLPPEIQHAIERRVAHPVHGYTLEPESYYEAAQAWFRRRHGWVIDRAALRPSPGVLASLTAAILAFTQPGDGVVIQPPVYHPFERKIRANGRAVVENPLVRSGSTYVMDLEGLERVVAEGARLLVLCNPHNPGGRVWPAESVAAAVRICARHGAVVVSDEIHCDIVLPPHVHTPALTSTPEAPSVTVTLVSATKTFNLAGLGGALSITPDAGMRGRLERVEQAIWAGTPNTVALAATEAAWRAGEGWLDALLHHVSGNYTHLVRELGRRLPAARVDPLEGTYLAWIDLSALDLDDEQVIRRLRAPGGVWLDEGRKFGRGGAGFQRMNLACPREHVTEAVARMARALAG